MTPARCRQTNRRYTQRLTATGAGAIALLILSGVAGSAAAAESATIFMYHRFGESRFPSTNVRLDQFEAHIRELTSGKYTVLPVSEIVDALRSGRQLPERTIGLTVDDGFLSVYTEAFPRLRAAGLPFTLFLATDPVDRGFAGMLNWRQIREMRDAGVDFGAHTASHLHMPEASDERNRAEMRRSLARLKEELGVEPVLFAYPYGESSLAVRRVVREFGFDVAFGQQSGSAHRSDDLLFLPRFPLNESYGDIDAFRLRANTIGLPVSDVTPTDPLVRDNNPPSVGFTVGESVGSLAGLACYHSQLGRATIELLGRHRVEVRFAEPFAPGRSRLNCTKPAGAGRWYWYGMQYYVPGN